MLAKKYRLSSCEIEEVFQKGRWRHQEAFSFKLYQNNLSFSRFAVIVSGKVVRRAVVRNRIRRRIMECLRLNYSCFPTGFDIIVIPKPIVFQEKFSEMEKEIRKFPAMWKR